MFFGNWQGAAFAAVVVFLSSLGKISLVGGGGGFSGGGGSFGGGGSSGSW